MEGRMHSEIESPDKRNQVTDQNFNELVIILKKKYDYQLTFKEACKYLNYAPSYLYKLCSFNSIPHHKKNGKELFFLFKEVDEWLLNSPKSRNA
jgi:excisionase family DNA binding protein